MASQTSARTDRPDLFTPVQLGPYRLNNRIVMAPMTRNRAGPGNVPLAINATYYRQRAGAGLIVSESSQVSPTGVGHAVAPGIYSAAQVAGWRPVTEAVHATGGRIFLQLQHVGRATHSSLIGGAQPVAPSAVRPAGEVRTPNGPQPFETPRELAIAEIPGIVAQFQSGARNALQAGMDGVEVHGASGYLIDQFLRDSTNRRTDAYGGPPAHRVRFLLEVVAAVCEVWGATRVGVRISPINSHGDIRDSNPNAIFGAVARALSGRGLAYLHVAEADSSKNPNPQSLDRAALRAAYDGLYIANGGYDRARADAVLAAGAADLVSFGRPFIANPDLPSRLARAAPLAAPDPATIYGGAEHGYIDYPTL